MKKFVKKLIIYIAIVFLSIVILFFIIDAIGWSDHNYKRFTSKGQQSLIVGTSRAAQGIQPLIINEKLSSTDFELPIYNFSFNVGESPYGELYFNAIKRKLGENNDKNSIFIVSVDPFGLAVEQKQDEGNYREYGRTLDKIRHFYKPQIYYLFNYCRPEKWRSSGYQTLHDDGWLEINVKFDSLSLKENIKRKMDDYNSHVISPSDYRIHWLVETIKLFKQNGTVFMCHIPISCEMSEWEDRSWPDFDKEMYEIAEQLNVCYFAFKKNRNDYRTTDGNHLFKDDGAFFTSDLCDSIIAVIRDSNNR